jgi:hypothetical protein
MNNVSQMRALIAPVVAGAVAGMLVLWALASAMHAPAPHGLPVGLVAPDQAATTISAQLEQKQPGAFTVVRYDNSDAARAAVDDRSVAGAVILGQGTMDIVVASGNGSASASAISGAFSAIAQATGVTPTVSDVHPLPAGDPFGIVPFFLVLAVALSGLIYGLISLLMGGNGTLAARLAAMVVFSILSGLLAAATVGFVTVFDSNLWLLAGVCTLLALSVAVTTVALQRLVGLPGTGLSALLVVILGMATSGGLAGPNFLADGFRELAGILPPSAALSAARSALYFGGSGSLGPVVVLAAWAVVAGVVLVAAERWLPARAAATPRAEGQA